MDMQVAEETQTRRTWQNRLTRDQGVPKNQTLTPISQLLALHGMLLIFYVDIIVTCSSKLHSTCVRKSLAMCAQGSLGFPDRLLLTSYMNVGTLIKLFQACFYRMLVLVYVRAHTGCEQSVLSSAEACRQISSPSSPSFRASLRRVCQPIKRLRYYNGLFVGSCSHPCYWHGSSRCEFIRHPPQLSQLCYHHGNMHHASILLSMPRAIKHFYFFACALSRTDRHDVPKTEGWRATERWQNQVLFGIGISLVAPKQ